MVDISLSPEPSSRGQEDLQGWRLQPRGRLVAGGEIAAQGLAPRLQVFEFLAVRGRLIEGGGGDAVLGDGDVEAVAEGLEVGLTHLLLGMGDVHALPSHAHAITLDGLGQDHRRLPLVLYRGLIGVEDLDGVVAAAVEAPDVLVRQGGDQLGQLRVFAEEVLAGVGAALGLVGLIIAVDALLHALEEQALLVAGEQRVPVAAPDDLDDVPAGAAEDRLQFLDDLAVAAHWAIQALQVAVDDEDEVVQPLPRRQGDGAQGLGLIHLAVAKEGPDLAALGVDQPPVLEIAHEPRLIDGHQGPQPHGDGGELPEVGHQPGMGIGGQAVAVYLLTEVVELLLADAPFQKGPGIDAGGGVALKEHQVAAVIRGAGAEEVVVADIHQGRRGGEGGDVPPQFTGKAIGLHHHGHGVPAHEGADAPLHGPVAGKLLLAGDGDGVEVGGVGAEGQIGPRASRLVDQAFEQEVGPLRALVLQHGLQGIEPLLGFLGIDVGFVAHGPASVMSVTAGWGQDR